MAGTAAGLTFGVAKGASLRVYKVLNDSGVGTEESVIAALEDVLANAATPGVVSIGLAAVSDRFSLSRSQKDAVSRLWDKGESGAACHCLLLARWPCTCGNGP